jgi:hypothetical protein
MNEIVSLFKLLQYIWRIGVTSTKDRSPGAYFIMNNWRIGRVFSSAMDFTRVIMFLFRPHL